MYFVNLEYDKANRRIETVGRKWTLHTTMSLESAKYDQFVQLRAKICLLHLTERSFWNALYNRQIQRT